MRLEHDSLGEIEVPEQARWGAQTQRAIENFAIAGRPMPGAFLRALARIKAACAEVHGVTAQSASAHGDSREALRYRAIARAAETIAAGAHADQFPVDVYQTGSGTSSNMNMNEVIASLATEIFGEPIHPNDHVNRGQSSNDVVPSAMMLAALEGVVMQLLPALVEIDDVLVRRGHELANVVKTGRTHLMDAMPVTFGQELSAWQSALAAHRERLIAALPRLGQLAIGGTAVGTGINAPEGFGEAVAERLARATGWPITVHPNSFAALSLPDSAGELSGLLAGLAGSLLKISNDLRLMNSGPLAGIGEIELPALQPGSSIMPGKVNPVIPEACAMAAVQVQGLDVAVRAAVASGAFQLNVMLPLIADNLVTMTQALARALEHLARLALAGFRVREARVREALDRNPILVTALNAEIGYERGAAIAKRAYAEGRSVLDVAAEETGRPRAELERLLDPVALTGR
ncbi:MAG: class II fumarate hydratase [Thioalkalivibrionaceae bacterium]